MSTFRAIVIEDSPQIKERIVEMLVAAGVEVIGTADTEDVGIALVKEHDFDYASVDLQLAQGTGFGVIRAIRAKPNSGKVCIAVMTNHAVPALKVAAFEAGADYFLDKSKDFHIPTRLVKELMDAQERAPASPEGAHPAT